MCGEWCSCPFGCGLEGLFLCVCNLFFFMVKDRIHWSVVLSEMVRARGADGGVRHWGLVFVKRGTGEVVRVDDCVVTSVHARGGTLNIRLRDEDVPKSVRKCLLLEFDGKEVIL